MVGVGANASMVVVQTVGVIGRESFVAVHVAAMEIVPRMIMAMLHETSVMIITK
jgi:hypothetical protein